MATEFEFQFIIEDIEKMRIRLAEAGYKPLQGFKQSVSNYYFYENESCKGFIRVRNSAKGNLITYKYFRDAHCEEIEIESGSDFSELEHFIEKIRPDTKKVNIEKHRQIWVSSNQFVNEIVIDKWPGLPEILEIDCKNEETLHQITNELLPDSTKKFTKGSFEIYEDLYGIKHEDLFKLSLQFSDIHKVLTQYINKNHDLFLQECHH